MDQELKDIDVATCYSRIVDWVRNYARKELERRDALPEATKVLELVERLPLPDEAKPEDMNFVFGEVLFGQFEWFFGQKDTYEVALNQYAKHAIELQYSGLGDEPFGASARKSALFQEFASPGWGAEYIVSPGTSAGV
jgi:hypothetical protein